MSMVIHLRLFASLRKWHPESAIDLELPLSGTVRDACDLIGVPEAEVAIIMVNGKRAKPDALLSDGDDLQLFPLIGGG